jgi:hypothetical protein
MAYCVKLVHRVLEGQTLLLVIDVGLVVIGFNTASFIQYSSQSSRLISMISRLVNFNPLIFNSLSWACFKVFK